MQEPEKLSFVISKILWVFVSPGNALVLLLLIGAFLAVAQNETRRLIGRRMCFVVALAFFVVGIFPVGSWMLIPLENRFPQEKTDHVDGIVLVGGDENPELTATRGPPNANLSSADYIAFAALARQFPQAKLVFTGGSGLIAPYADLKNSDVAKKALAEAGVPVDRMVFEDKSRTTYENAVDTAAIVHPTKQQKWLLVTSAVHMPRSVACFRKAGWNVVPTPSSYFTTGRYSARLRFALADHLMETDIAVHEYVGLLAYRVMGYTDELWPH